MQNHAPGTQSNFRIDRWTIGITLVVLTLSFFLHLKWCGSTLRFGIDTWNETLRYHLDNYPFSIRLINTNAIIFLMSLFGLSVKATFFAIQFSLAAAIAILFQYFLRLLKFDILESRLGLFLILSSYPMLAAHMEPMHIWDDMWAWLFMLLAAILLVNRKITFSALAFLIAVFAREQTVIYLPALVSFVWVMHGKKDGLKVLSWFAGAAVLYAIYFAFVAQPVEPGRLSLIVFNFENWIRSRDTLFSLFIVLGLSWVTLAIALKQKTDKLELKALKYGCYWSLPVTLVLALFFSLTRETRILFPPFIFVLPLSLMVILQRVRAFKEFFDAGEKRGARIAVGILVAIVLIMIGMKTGRWVFPAFEYRQCGNFQTQWAGVNFSGILILVASYLLKRLNRNQS